MNASWKGAQRLLITSCALALAACGGGNEPDPVPTSTPSASPTPAAPAVSNAGLVLLLHMDEAAWSGAAGQVVDSSGAHHDGTATGGATTTTAGKFGRGGLFTGGPSCVVVGDAAALRPTTQLSVSAWVLPTGLGRQEPMGIAAKRGDFQVRSAYAFFLDTDDRLTVDVDTEDNRFQAGPAFANGRWTHVAFVYDGALPAAARVSVYVDGALAGTGAEGSASITGFAEPLAVGCLPLGPPAQGFVGTMDEVAVWHRALSAAEVAALAAASGPLRAP